MIDMLRDPQIPFLASVLILACAAKLTVREHDPAPPVALHRQRPFVYGVALAEGVIGVALMVTPTGVVRAACVVFFASATWITGDLARRGTDEGCGCFGGLSAAPAGRRGLIRAALLTIVALASAGSPETGAQVLGRAGAGTVLLLAAETGLLLVLSPELALAVERTRNSTPCELLDVPLAETYARLHASVAWGEYEDHVTSARPIETWRELCHRYVVFPARVEGRRAELVFAVPIDGRRAEVRAGLVWDADCEGQDDDSGPRRVSSPA
ncbi:MAG: MauE/DoxX family redox-associated membrane protein [Actinoallomurus sp.]